MTYVTTFENENVLRESTFNAILNINGVNINTVQKNKLLGTVITDHFKWDQNTKEIIKNANMRMCLIIYFHVKVDFRSRFLVGCKPKDWHTG